MKVAVVGDIHAHKHELLDMIAQLEARRVDRIIFLGDLLDRGPHGFECLKIARLGSFKARCGRMRRFEAVRGNHEDAYCRAAKGLPKPGEMQPMRASCDRTLRRLTRDEIEWMWTRPVKLGIPELNLLLVHGGILPSMLTEDQLDARVMRVRYLDDKGSAIGGFRSSSRFWADEYDGRFGFVLYGHQSFLTPRRSPWALGLDGEGCGALHAAIFSNETNDGRVIYRTLTVKRPEPALTARPTKLCSQTMPLFAQLDQFGSGLPW